MIKLEVNKQYLLNTGERAVCVFKRDAWSIISPFLLVVKDSHKTFWCNEAGTGECDVHVTKEIGPRQTSAGYVNIYRCSDGKLYMGEFWESWDKAKAAAYDDRVGIIPVELINNIEIGEVKG